MAGNVITVGAKIELTRLNARKKQNTEGMKVYYSKVLDIIEDEDGMVIKAAVPLDEGRIVPLAVGAEYDAYFSEGSSIYAGPCRITGRSKDMNIYTMDIVLIGDLHRVQRRGFYRLPCSRSVKVQVLTDFQAAGYERTHQWNEKLFQNARPVLEATLIDLSGGGIRMHSGIHYEKESLVRVFLDIICNDEPKQLELLGEVVMSYSLENDRSIYETRVQFKAVPNEITEMIVKYIFMEQRITQQKLRR